MKQLRNSCYTDGLACFLCIVCIESWGFGILLVTAILHARAPCKYTTSLSQIVLATLATYYVRHFNNEVGISYDGGVRRKYAASFLSLEWAEAGSHTKKKEILALDCRSGLSSYPSSYVFAVDHYIRYIHVACLVCM